MSILSRWTGRLTARRKLEAAARERHQDNPTKDSLAWLKKRKAQTAFALRVVQRQRDRIRIVGNKVTGGTPRTRLVAAARRSAYMSATGKRKSFYSQSGAWTVNYGITGEPRGYRSDCSQWVTSMYHSAGLPDPNRKGYSGGFTGTLAEGGRYVTRAQVKPGDLLMVGRPPFHHVELIVNARTGATIGHGTAPIDGSNINRYNPVRYVTYDFLG